MNNHEYIIRSLAPDIKEAVTYLLGNGYNLIDEITDRIVLQNKIDYLYNTIVFDYVKGIANCFISEDKIMKHYVCRSISFHVILNKDLFDITIKKLIEYYIQEKNNH